VASKATESPEATCETSDCNEPSITIIPIKVPTIPNAGDELAMVWRTLPKNIPAVITVGGGFDHFLNFLWFISGDCQFKPVAQEGVFGNFFFFSGLFQS
jgi:hypothetical protein